jgi:hypothetical protein
VPSLSRISLACLATCALAGSALPATDTAFGLQAAVMFPTGDLNTLTNKSTGFGAGTHLMVDLGDGHVIRPRLDFFSYPGQSGYYKLQQFSGGADYVYFIDKKPTRGTYLVAGLGLASNSYETNFQPSYSRAYTNPYGALGVGYQVHPNVGVEFRYISSRFTDTRGVTSSVNSLGVGATVRF